MEAGKGWSQGRLARVGEEGAYAATAEAPGWRHSRQGTVEARELGRGLRIRIGVSVGDGGGTWMVLELADGCGGGGVTPVHMQPTAMETVEPSARLPSKSHLRSGIAPRIPCTYIRPTKYTHHIFYR